MAALSVVFVMDLSCYLHVISSITNQWFFFLNISLQMFDWITHNKGLFLNSYTEIGTSHPHAMELQTQHNHFAMNCMVRMGLASQHWHLLLVKVEFINHTHKSFLLLQLAQLVFEQWSCITKEENKRWPRTEVLWLSNWIIWTTGNIQCNLGTSKIYASKLLEPGICVWVQFCIF